MSIEEMKKRYEPLSMMSKSLMDKIHKKCGETEHYSWDEIESITHMLKNLVKIEAFINSVHYEGTTPTKMFN
jgi:hypothetical protein